MSLEMLKVSKQEEEEELAKQGQRFDEMEALERMKKDSDDNKGLNAPGGTNKMLGVGGVKFVSASVSAAKPSETVSRNEEEVSLDDDDDDDGGDDGDNDDRLEIQQKAVPTTVYGALALMQQAKKNT
eukprot:TRINITY_DN4942_c0_g4_i1.p1 TRINITY_DN4942_c0_g4~~TRINITY_DN4942_c0_g4_i1.p1  ORF type:complete len:127 (+),score=65.35 TRINITY_DN4942_c0_g4_i1:188-568(+)